MHRAVFRVAANAGAFVRNCTASGLNPLFALRGLYAWLCVCLWTSDKPSGRLALCFELMDMNIYEHIRNRKTYLPENKIKLFMFQVLKSVDHMHRNGIFHRDIKPVRPLALYSNRKGSTDVEEQGSGGVGSLDSKPECDLWRATSLAWHFAPESIICCRSCTDHECDHNRKTFCCWTTRSRSLIMVPVVGFIPNRPTRNTFPHDGT